MDTVIEGDNALTIALTHRVTELYELPLDCCIRFLDSLNLQNRPAAVKEAMLHTLWYGDMEVVETLLELEGVEAFSEEQDDEAIEEDPDWSEEMAN